MLVGFTSHCRLGLAPYLGFGSLPLFVFILGPRLKGQCLPGETLLIVMAEVLESKPNYTKTFQTFVCIISANIPLAKAGQMTKTWGQGNILCPP